MIYSFENIHVSHCVIVLMAFTLTKEMEVGCEEIKIPVPLGDHPIHDNLYIKQYLKFTRIQQ